MDKAHRFYHLTPEGKVEPATVDEWAACLASLERRRIAESEIETTDGRRCAVSTIFIGLNRSFEPDKVIVFETLVTLGEDISLMPHSGTYADAVAAHNAIAGSVQDQLLRGDNG